ncbi:MAG TPA: hypothetical protein VL354_07270 [Spirochaetia bacterium]|nr:hypothetical protein [Spirochaetia bacterium]
MRDRQSEEALDMYVTEVDPLLEELEHREFRRGRRDRAQQIAEIRERFERVLRGEKAEE